MSLTPGPWYLERDGDDYEITHSNPTKDTSLVATVVRKVDAEAILELGQHRGVTLGAAVRVLRSIEGAFAKGDAHNARHMTRGILRDVGVDPGAWK